MLSRVKTKTEEDNKKQTQNNNLTAKRPNVMRIIIMIMKACKDQHLASRYQYTRYHLSCSGARQWHTVTTADCGYILGSDFQKTDSNRVEIGICERRPDRQTHTSSEVFLLFSSARGPVLNWSQLSWTGSGKPTTSPVRQSVDSISRALTGSSIPSTFSKSLSNLASPRREGFCRNASSYQTKSR